MSFKPERFFGAAIEAVRRALRDLEAEQVPAGLKRVAAYGGGSLPPPFARSVLRELEGNEFIRGKALEAWNGDPPRAGRGRASLLLLERAEGWLEELLAIVHAEGSRGGERIDQQLEVERDALAAEVVALKERLKAARAEADAAKGEAREERRRERDPARAEGSRVARLTAEIESRDTAVADLERRHRLEVEQVAAQLAETREALRAARKERADAVAAATGAEDPPGLDSPDDLARFLDRLAASVTVQVAGRKEAVAPAVDEPLEFPSALRPDTAGAVDWMIGVGDVQVLVDGYNLGFLLAGRLDPPTARLRTDEVVRRLASASTCRIVVVYDSKVDADPGDHAGSGRVTVIYSDGQSADDVIVGMAARGSRTLVVSNDREVRHRSEAAGAVAIWSDAVAQWSRRR